MAIIVCLGVFAHRLSSAIMVSAARLHVIKVSARIFHTDGGSWMVQVGLLICSWYCNNYRYQFALFWGLLI